MCLPIILLILVGVELPLRVAVTILECCVMFSGVKLSIRSFVLLSVFRPISILAQVPDPSCSISSICFHR